jgi:hypothetical protein
MDVNDRLGCEQQAAPHQLVEPNLLAVACAASSCQDDLFRLG